MPTICAQLATARSCGCATGHDISGFCTVCDIFCVDARQLLEHQRGGKHRRKLVVKGPTPLGWCSICVSQVPTTGVGWLVHQSGIHHRQLATVAARPPPQPVKTFVCETCQKAFKTKRARIQHKADKSHQTQPLVAVAVTAPSYPALQLSATSVRAAPGAARQAAPQMGRRRQRMFFRGRFIAGPPRSVYSSIPYKRRLKEHPLDVTVVVEGSEEERLEKIRAILPTDLNPTTYARHWHTLIHVEEEQMM